MAIANFMPLFRWFRRQTLWLNVLGGLLVTLAIVLPFPLGAQTVFPEIRGVWITNNDTVHFMDQTRTRESVDLLADLNFNTLYPVVWNSGYVLYESAIAKREGIQPFSPKGDQGQDVLADLITQAHRRKLLVLPWFEFGFMAPPFSELVKRHPTWLTQRQDGSQTSISAAGEVVWLNPFRPEVQQFMTELVMEVVHNYDIDGVQFDDHTALPNEFGYDPYTIALYQQETEQAPPKDPKDANWTRWRADKITAFMTQLNLTIKAAKPNILVSLSPATYRLAYNTYLQDWLDWVRKGIVDEVVVQVYRTSLPTFQEPIRRAEFQEAKTKVPTAVGILTGLPTKQVPMPLVTAKVREATGQGMGTAFFYYKTLWDVAPEEKSARIQEFKRLFPYPAPRSLAKIVPPPINADPLAPLSPPSVPPVSPRRAPPLNGIPITVEFPGQVAPPSPSFPPPLSSPSPPPPRPQDGFPPEPTLDETIPTDWYP
ncbi:MAG: family 10 glycosylhydrolase [Synechocystis sp.]|nr:family 10 glycosylhydrolase [Synechocystis sp.]